MTTQEARRGTIERPRNWPAPLEKLRRWLLQRVWYVYPGLTLTVTLPPPLCIRVLGTTSRPDATRLEFRHLFSSGRRYHLQHTPTGFAVMTTSKVFWYHRRRTSPAAILFGDFEEVDRTLVRIHLRGRIRPGYLLSSFLLPLFFSSMIVLMPWHPLIIGILVLALFGFSWAGHRLNAALETFEMAHYVCKALEAYMPEQPPAVGPGGVISSPRDREFAEAWEKFYEAHRGDARDTRS